MKPTQKKSRVIARERYIDPSGLDIAELRYFSHDSKHVVVLEYHDEDCPRVSRYATVDEARNRWREARRNLAALGYIRA